MLAARRTLLKYRESREEKIISLFSYPRTRRGCSGASGGGAMASVCSAGGGAPNDHYDTAGLCRGDVAEPAGEGRFKQAFEENFAPFEHARA